MRNQGRITSWKDEQGFGFITPNGGGKQVFVHIKAFTGNRKRPSGGELVTYRLITDEKNRPTASEVLYVGSPRHKPLTIGKSSVPIYFTSIFLVIMCLAVIIGAFPLFILTIYAVTSLLTLILYWRDKRAAENDKDRTPEIYLQSLSLIGGWPGGIFAQRIFRHKTTKKSFQAIFWLQVFLNLTGLFILGSPVARKLFLSVTA
ncbi:MAG: DUF1294 domain-containing protein [Betaproteobacteria bacterium HGW-Betaproteobacteria-20]|jgi:uncharacterized membrane protein YsdA (DUF1294 family)/cold shock CspA family protein|nr:MAG: DUF1294 domain-containing protein [Betaproteobacteria bacterium HGW-Betaproteobacteria-20]